MIIQVACLLIRKCHTAVNNNCETHSLLMQLCFIFGLGTEFGHVSHHLIEIKVKPKIVQAHTYYLPKKLWSSMHTHTMQA